MRWLKDVLCNVIMFAFNKTPQGRSAILPKANLLNCFGNMLTTFANAIIETYLKQCSRCGDPT